MGLIADWSRLASQMPRLANALTHTPGLSTLAKWAGGIAPQRRIPRYASPTFVQWFKTRRDRRLDGQRVMLWPDTFNNYFRPETAIAATRALEELGFTVVIPKGQLCCGRPLYDWGMLDKAKRRWN